MLFVFKRIFIITPYHIYINKNKKQFMLFIFILYIIYEYYNHLTVSYRYGVYCMRMPFRQYCDDLTTTDRKWKILL